MYLLGIDLGSSSVKASIIDASNGNIIAQGFEPKEEMNITAHNLGWAEQDPELWWRYTKKVISELIHKAQINKSNIKAIGISYQMHSLVLVDKSQNVLRPSIIWCDSRAVSIGEKAYKFLGSEYCTNHLLNSPGNFTASKLKWVKDHEPDVFNKIYKMMLPGDFIAMKLTNEITTTVCGLSEAILWDFKANNLSQDLLDYYGIDSSVIPDIKNTFSSHGTILNDIADELGLPRKIKVTYKSGDQPNNAYALNVLRPGEIAATAGTSGVIYGITEKIIPDLKSRVNVFAHVNHKVNSPRLGILACINGTGILNSWLKKNVASNLSYTEMDKLAESVETGSDGLKVFPFGNGSERILSNLNLGCIWQDLNFNKHNKAHLLRASQEGIVFSFYYALNIIKSMGLDVKTIRAGNTNMFQSKIFRESLAALSGVSIEIFNSDGANGAALASGIASNVFTSHNQALKHLKKIETIEPNINIQSHLNDIYENWEESLKTKLKQKKNI